MSTHKRLHAVVHGRVQGVSFRFYTVQQAGELGLTGWVRNNRDDTVEVVAEGDPDALAAFHEWLHRGSPAAYVERVDADWPAATGEFTRFDVMYDGP